MRFLYVENNTNKDEMKFSPKLQALVHEFGDIHVVDNRKDAVRALETHEYDGAILSGSSENLSNNIPKDVLSMNAAVLTALKAPVLGVCFGMQVMAILHGGDVTKLSSRSRGVREVLVQNSLLMPSGILKAKHAHGDAVTVVPPGFTVTARIESQEIAIAIENWSEERFGVQFHPEGDPVNRTVIEAFARRCEERKTKICCRGAWHAR